MKKVAVISIFLGLLCVVDVLSAADFIIESGQTVNTTQVLTDPGDQGLIEQGGTINVSGVSGVELLNENQRVVNKGVIQTFEGFGIFSQVGANNSRVENDGSIQTAGADAMGIFNIALQVKAVNNGSIITQGVNSYGMYNANGDNVIFINNGLISTQQQDATGILNALGENFEVYNDGTIQTQGNYAHGILDNLGNNPRITNNGLIHTRGLNSYGIYLFNELNPHVINSGTIISDQTYAIYISSAINPTLTLRKGSNLQGDVGSLNDQLNLMN